MSIIQEALKKAENFTKDKSKSGAFVEPDKNKKRDATLPDVMLAKKKASLNKNTAGGKKFPLRVTIAAAALLAIGTMSLLYFVHRSSGPAYTKPANETVIDISMPKTQGPAALELQSLSDVKARYSDLTLNGIMVLETGSRAIINDAVVEEGGTVKGAKVVKINPKSVVLNDNGAEITLNLK